MTIEVAFVSLMYSIAVNVSAGIDFLTRSNPFTLQPFPTVAHVSDDFANLISAMLPLFYTLVYLFPVSQITQYIVEEKELRIKVGLSSSD